MSKMTGAKLNPVWIVLFILMVLTDFGLLIANLLRGKNVALFNPKGLIAHEQHSLMMVTATVLLIVGIPTLCLLFFTAWKYRESNTKVSYDPDKRHGRWFNFGAWAVPTTVMLVLA